MIPMVVRTSSADVEAVVEVLRSDFPTLAQEGVHI